MKQYDFAIVGGSAAGIQAAIVAQRQHQAESILVVREEDKVLIPCGIPYIYGTLGAVGRNVIPDALLGNADLLIDTVVSIDREAHTINTFGGETIGYKKLLLATGSVPVEPPISGLDLENVFFIRKERQYLHSLREAMAEAHRLVINGGGFIGIEFADECTKRGLDVTIMELLPHCLQLVCPEELCIRIENKLQERGVRVLTGKKVVSIGGEGKAEYVELEGGERLKADLVLIAIGTKPNTELAQKAGLEIGEQKGISVNEYMRTSDPDILAAGDCAEKYSFFTRKPIDLRLASIAAREGKIAAANILVPKWRNEGTIGIFATVVGDLAIGVCGLTEDQARKEGFNVIVGESTGVNRHPAAMPGAREMMVKLIFDRKSGKMLGGSVCCSETAGEIANLMAAAIVSGMGIEELAILPMGTHPALTASPLSNHITEAACQVLSEASAGMIL